MRYLPHTESERQEMLRIIGVESVDALFRSVPQNIYHAEAFADLPLGQGEIEVERFMQTLADKNKHTGSMPSFLGAGAYRHHIPAAVDHLIQRGEFLTSYTPYQPEVAQGTLQYLFEFQTYVALLTGMEVANASMYDGSTACGEAVLMANRITKRKRALLSGGLHPQYRDVATTLAKWTGFDAAVLPPCVDRSEDLIASLDEETSCVVVQYPDVFGGVQDLSDLAEAVHKKGALLIVVVTEIVALGLLPSPGEMGADIVVGEGQSLGNALSFGGPYVGLFATRECYLRQMPGRLAGETVDVDGKRGWVLTLSAREQHIRREKATSNICTNSGLCALAFTIHLSLLGEDGFKTLAILNHEAALRLAERLSAIPQIEVVTTGFFNELAIRLPVAAAPLVDRLVDQGVLAGVPLSRLYPGDPRLENMLLVAATEVTTTNDIEALAYALQKALS